LKPWKSYCEEASHELPADVLDALEEAYTITKHIHDPSLKKNLVERIFECFVQIGCLEIQEHHNSNQLDQILPALRSFERSLELLHLHLKNEEISLKIANLIDIVLKASIQKFSENFYIPLALFSLQIEKIDTSISKKFCQSSPRKTCDA
jgi:hypothetical protein